jgi:molybdenum cofactor synthesis domain-containing protein
MRALALTISNRVHAGVYEDTAGPVIAEALESLGFTVVRQVVSDGDPVGPALRAAVADGLYGFNSTGGTGHTPLDATPDNTRGVLDREIPGIAEAIRAYGVAHGIATAALSRGLAGVAGDTLIVNLPGSPGGARDGMAVLAPVLVHAVEQIRGGDH